MSSQADVAVISAGDELDNDLIHTHISKTRPKVHFVCHTMQEQVSVCCDDMISVNVVIYTRGRWLWILINAHHKKVGKVCIELVVGEYVAANTPATYLITKPSLVPRLSDF